MGSLVALGQSETPAGSTSPPAQAESFFLVVTGGELLEGRYTDAHTSYLTRTLRPLGLACVGSLLVGDEAADIRAALEFALRQAPLVVVTGGLGPTANDLTREVLSEYTGIPLAEDPELVRELARRFQTEPERLRPNLRRQARVPTRGRWFPNSHGTAAGLLFPLGQRRIVALPGPPRELQPMVQSALLPWLEKEYGLHRPGCHLKLRFVGIGQSLIDQTLRERAPPPADALISSEFEGSRVDFTFSLREDSEANRARLRVFAAEVRKQLGPSLYAEGDATLEQLAAARMQAEAAKVVLAEAAPFGALATALGRSSETRTVVQGAYQAPSEEGLRRLLGISDERWGSCRTAEERATLLAEAARAATGAAWVIAVGEARNASTASPAVCVALLMGGRPVQLWRVPLPESAEAGRANLVTEVMDRIRRIP